MTRYFVSFVCLFLSVHVWAKSPCDAIHGEKIHSQLIIRTGVVCFVRQPVEDERGGAPTGVDEVALFLIKDGGVAIKAEGRGLLYDESPGDIADAFVISSDDDNLGKVVVIQSIEIRNSLSEVDSSGRFYSVSVFDQADAALRRNERASYWFGDGYGWIKRGGKYVYEFPYKTKKSVMESSGSPFSPLMYRDASIRVRVTRKTKLYEGPEIQDGTRKYLIAGDLAVVDNVTAGWCQLNYSGVGKPIKMWTMCSALEPAN